mmetsp:Transcript_11487/g.20655  ORF Transcript_11487/g.20655 Transcript_11487/m.20655 type:complete len:155 (+) Transcript_11487:421-885(+)
MASQSRWLVGSSRRRTSARCARAAASATRFRSPPDRDETGRRRNAPAPTSSRPASSSSCSSSSHPPSALPIRSIAAAIFSSAAASALSFSGPVRTRASSVAAVAAQYALTARSDSACFVASGVEALGPATMVSVSASATVHNCAPEFKPRLTED